MDLHFLVKALDSILDESEQSVVLLHVGSTVLVEVVVLAVTAVEQCLEGQDDVGVHSVDPVTPEEEGVQGTPDLAAILRGQILLDVLPRQRGSVSGVEYGPNLLRIREEGYGEWAIGLKLVQVVHEVTELMQDRCPSMEVCANSCSPKAGSSAL
jgi:hypothetical protein